MVDCPNLDAKLRSYPEGLRLNHLTLLEFLDASINIFSKQIFHTLFEHVLPRILLVWETSKAYHLAVEDIYRGPQNFKPIISVISANQVKILFPVKQLRMAHRRLAQSYNDTVKIFRHSGIEVEFTSELVCIHGDDVLVSNLFGLKQSIAFVDLCISADETRKLFLDLQKVFFVRNRVRILFRLLNQLFVKYTGCEILGIEDSNFLLIDENHEETFIQEKALID